MPIIKSAQKRARQTTVRHQRNLVTKQSMRTEIKALDAAIASGKSKDIEDQFKKAQSAIDTAAKKNIIHKNKAARKKSQLSVKVKAASSTKTTTVKKPATKKPASKKSA